MSKPHVVKCEKCGGDQFGRNIYVAGTFYQALKIVDHQIVVIDGCNDGVVSRRFPKTMRCEGCNHRQPWPSNVGFQA